MPHSTKDITGDSANILLIGDSGTHKTFFMATVPDIYVFDFDKGMSVLREVDVQYDTFKDAAKGMEVGPRLQKLGLYKWGTAWDAFHKRVIELNALYEKGQGPKAIGLDSLTTMSMIAVNKILLDTGHASPHQGTWGAHHDYFKTIFSIMTTWPAQLIATAHIERTNNDLTGIVEKLPLLAGKMAGLVPIYFDEVYFCESAVDAKGAQKFTIKTKSNPSMRQAKSRWGVPDDTETSFAAIAKYFPKEVVK